MNAPLLSVSNASIEFGGVRALQGVSLDVFEDEICGLIGPNGAGKTTLFNAISRVYRIDSGSIRFGNEDITDFTTDRVIGRGIARTTQNVGLFGDQTVIENVMLGAHHRIKPTFSGAIFGSRRARDCAIRTEALKVLSDLGLSWEAETLVSELPFGTQKRIELARALLAQPRLLLLDEPANGLSHSEVDVLSDLILDLRSRFKLTVLLVEHHMRMVMRISDRVVVLENGAKIAEGTPQQVKADPRVADAYLGTAA